MSSEPSFFGDVPAYERFMGRYSDQLAVAFARLAGVESGQTVVDVGCGTGALTAVLAGIVGAENVAGIDPTESFVEATAARVPGADLRLGSAEHLPFEVATFDRALSQLVFAFVADPHAAAAEMRRVTKPGGRAAACMWEFTGGGMTMMKIFWDALGEVDPTREPPPRRFGGGPGELENLWRETGFDEVDAGRLTISAGYAGFDDFIAGIESGPGPVGETYAGLADDDRVALGDALRRRVGDPQGPFTMEATVLYAIGSA
jgi:SAM-dependent methyltransferase